MIDETIVAVFDTADHAGAAVRDLLAAKIPKGAIDQNAFRPGHAASGDDTADTLEGCPISVSVTVKRAHVIQVLETLERHNPIDLDEPILDYSAKQVSGGETLHLAEEQLDIGVRSINRGGTRVHRYATATPVERKVTLRDEAVTVERRPVTDGRRVAEAQFSDVTVEAMAVAEEAVVAKTVHVREEVSLRKETVERVKTVRDTVRCEDIAIERVPGNSAE